MIALTLAEIRDLTGGRSSTAPTCRRPSSSTAPSPPTHATCGPGSLYVARVGEPADGHDFVARAVARAARWPRWHRARRRRAVRRRRGRPDRLRPRRPRRVDRAPELRVVGVTGSSGKTAPRTCSPRCCPAGPRPSHPSTRSTARSACPSPSAASPPTTRFLVAEMGARGIGHIDYLTRIAPPQVAIVLNVGTAHVGEFGSRENIARAKAELPRALSRRGPGRPQRRRPASSPPWLGRSPPGGRSSGSRPRRTCAPWTSPSTSAAGRHTPSCAREGGASLAAAERRPPGRQLAGRRCRRPRARPVARPGGRGSAGSRGGEPLADGDHRPPRRGRRRQRRLQREPRLDACRARRASPRWRVAGERWAVLGAMLELGDRRRRRARGRRVVWPPRSASTTSWPSARAPRPAGRRRVPHRIAVGARHRRGPRPAAPRLRAGRRRPAQVEPRQRAALGDRLGRRRLARHRSPPRRGGRR